MNKQPNKQKVVFIDRDGVINKYPGDGKYVTCWDEFEFIDGSIKAISDFNARGFTVFVISNQAGVAKGLYTQKDLDYLTGNMLSAMAEYDAKAVVRAVYYCTHRDQDKCSCRKPNTGLLKTALADFNIEPDPCFFIGDSLVDMKTAVNFGAVPVLVLSGKEKEYSPGSWTVEPDYVFKDLLTASSYLCSESGIIPGNKRV